MKRPPTLQLSNTRWTRLNQGDTDRNIIALLHESGIDREAQEVFVVLPLRADLATCGPIEVARGGWDTTMVSVPAVMSAVVAAGCDRFAVAHNHPTDDPVQSWQDQALIERLTAAAATVGLTFERSYVVTPSGRWSVQTVNVGGSLAQAAERRGMQ